jgi:hypothetical protein
MNVIKHTKYIWELENFLDDKQLDSFFETWRDLDLKPDLRSRNRKRENNTFLLDMWSAGDHDIVPLNRILWRYIMDAHNYYLNNNKFLFYGANKKYFENVEWIGANILRTYDESDYYQWHTDHIRERESELSYIIYLNDDFEGGKTCFFNDKIGITPKKGSVLCFPVDHYHTHKSTKIKSGTKYILWNCLARLRDQIDVNNRAHIWR